MSAGRRSKGTLNFFFQIESWEAAVSRCVGVVARQVFCDDGGSLQANLEETSGVCHFSPLETDVEQPALAVGDMVKVDVGCHIDGAARRPILERLVALTLSLWRLGHDREWCVTRATETVLSSIDTLTTSKSRKALSLSLSQNSIQN